MGILLNINRCINSIPNDIIDDKTIYIEVDKKSYDLLQEEITTVTGATDLKFVEQLVEDMGTCSVFSFNGYTVIVALDSRIKKEDPTNFYVAFKTKII
jgi:hypothetical protein